MNLHENNLLNYTQFCTNCLFSSTRNSLSSHFIFVIFFKNKILKNPTIDLEDCKTIKQLLNYTGNVMLWVLFILLLSLSLFWKGLRESKKTYQRGIFLA